MDIGCVNGCPEAGCDCNYIVGLENKIKGLKSENKKLKLEIKKLEQSLKDSSALLEAKAKQFEEAKGRALERQEPTLEKLQREPIPAVWQGNRVELLEDVDIFPKGTRGTVVEIFIANGQVGYYVEIPFCVLLDRSQFKVVEDER